MKKTNDLTDGSIAKKLMLFFLPIAGGTVFQQLYNAVDCIVVSKYVGTDALAAVGGSSSVLSGLLIGFFTALASGAAVVIAQDYGARQYKKVSQEIHTSMTFCGAVGILLAIAVTATAPFILKAMKTPAETVEQAAVYTRIYFSGSVFTLLYNMGAGIIRAMGNSEKPFRYLIVSSIANIILDLVFVIVFKMGVAGVALATVIAQCISTVLVFIDLFRLDPEMRLDLKKIGIERGILAQMMKIGIPAGLESAMYGGSHIIVQIGTNTLGTVAVASWTMAGKIDGVYWSVASALGAAMTTFVGQNYGAGKQDRVKKSVKTGFSLFSALTVAISALIMVFAKPLLGIFTDDAAVRSGTMTLFFAWVPFYLLWTLIEIITGVLRGVGDAATPVAITGVGVCVFRAVWIFTVFRYFHTAVCLAACYPASWVVTGLALFVYYKFFSRMKRERTKE